MTSPSAAAPGRSGAVLDAHDRRAEIDARISGIARRDRRTSPLWLALAMLAALPSAAGAQAPDANPAYATQPFTPQGFRLPDGQGCAGDVARWQAIQDNDYRSGNIGLPVYHRIAREIAQASAACQAGHDAQASALVRASRARHGYPQ